MVVLHVSAQNWNEADPISFQWNVFNIYNGLVRWCVPVLLMISGPLFLKRDIPIKTLYSKYILRLAIAYLVHVLVMDELARAGLHSLCVTPVIAIPAISLLIAIGSFAISFVLNKIPVIRRWIV